MFHRTKPFKGTENIEVYRNCTFLKLTNRKGEEPVSHILQVKKREELVLLVTSQLSEQQFPTGIFSDSRFRTDLSTAIEAINSFIDTVGRNKTLDRRYSATAHTLYCTLQEYDSQCREAEEEAISTSFRTSSPSTDPCSEFTDVEDWEERMGQIETSAIQALGCKSSSLEYIEHGIHLKYTHMAVSVTDPSILYVESSLP